MMRELRQSGSVLLLTIMIMAVLTTVTLGGVALRFNDLSSTDNISNSAVAKQAADSALSKLKVQLTNNNAPSSAHVVNLNNNTDSVLNGSTSSFKPNPLTSTATYEPVKTSLPRCLAVAVLSPWVNTGQYLFTTQAQGSTTNNPALIFHYANIVSDTALGTVADNQTTLASNTDKQTTIGQLVNLGHFYNPYTSSTDQADPNYWLVKLGGPQDQFLTKKSVDGQTSYYKNLDFVYAPYLPRFTDTGIFNAATSGTQIDRISADGYRQLFENTIKNNNFRVWLDAAVTNDIANQYGFGDLFTSDSQYRVTWLQPDLWNDNVETSQAGPYVNSDVDATQEGWSKQAQPLYIPGASDTGWNVAILKGAQSFSFMEMNTGSSNTTFSPNSTVDGFLYGSLSGLRFNQPVTLVLYGKNSQPLDLDHTYRNFDQGKIYNATLTKLGPVTVSNGVETYPISFRLSNNAGDVPHMSTGSYATNSDISMISIQASAQFSTANSVANTTLSDANGDGKDAVVTIGANPNCNPVNVTACPAVGDLVSLSKTNTAPLWGVVKTATFNSGGTVLAQVTIDALHQFAKPTRDAASTVLTDPRDGRTKIAYYGGSMIDNDYDAGNNSEGNELWLYDPENNTWSWINGSGTTPGKRAGASMVFDSTNGRLLLFGGYYHEQVGGSNCTEAAQYSCLYSNRVGLRIARRITNDVYDYNFSTNSWEKISYTFQPTQKIQAGVNYQVQTIAPLGIRSGLDWWWWMPVANYNGTSPVTLATDGSENVGINVSNSAAGLAKGDDLYLYGTKTDGSAFSGWGKITDVNFPNGTINLAMYGYKATTGSSVSLSYLAIQVSNRQAATSTCTGQFDSLTSLYSCSLSGGDTTGYSVGDLVTLNQYTTDKSGNGSLTSTLSGYVSYIENGKLYFVADERNAAVNDFSVATTGKIANESAVAFPSPRFTAELQVQPTNATTAYLYQGDTHLWPSSAHYADLWKLTFTAGQTTGSGSAVWQLLNSQTNVPSTSQSAYNFHVVQAPWQEFFFTGATNSPELIPTKCPDNNPSCSAGQKTWDDTQKWTLPIKTSGVESNAAAKVESGASVTIERQNDTTGNREVFHGKVTDDSFTASNNGVNFVVQHDPSYGGDLGIGGNTNNVKVTIFYQNRTDIILNTGTWNAGNYFQLDATTDKTIIPSVGVTVDFWATNTSTSSFDAFTATVSNRAYDPVTNKFRFYFYDKPLNSPVPAFEASSQLVADGATTQALTIGFDAFSGHYGGLEWYATVTDAIPRWQGRSSSIDSSVQEGPTQRLGGALSTIYGSGGDKLYMVGGGMIGQYSEFWRESNAGKISTSTPPTWRYSKGAVTSSADLPLLLGGSLLIYNNGSANKAVYFGGKARYNWAGGEIFGRPDLDRWTFSDGSYTLAGKNSSLPAASFFDAISNNFNGPQAVKQSFQFSGTGISNGGGSGWTYTQNACAYVGQASGCTSAMLPLNLGTLGRISGDPTSGTNYGGGSWSTSRAVINPGSAFLSQNGSPNLLLSGPTMSFNSTNGRFDQSGYNPYLTDTSLPYGSTGSNFASDKTLMLAGFASISGGGSLLVTPAGIGIGLTRGSNNRWYSYCAKSDVTDLANGDYSCKTNATNYLSFLPDPEDQLFLFNAALTLSSTDAYKVVGYYAGVRRGYLVSSRTGQDLNVQEIVP